MYTQEDILDYAKARNLSREEFNKLLESIGRENITTAEPTAEAPVVPQPEEKIIEAPPLPKVPLPSETIIPTKIEEPAVQQEDSFFQKADEIEALQREELPPVEKRFPSNLKDQCLK